MQMIKNREPYEYRQSTNLPLQGWWMISICYCRAWRSRLSGTAPGLGKLFLCRYLAPLLLIAKGQDIQKQSAGSGHFRYWIRLGMTKDFKDYSKGPNASPRTQDKKVALGLWHLKFQLSFFIVFSSRSKAMILLLIYLCAKNTTLTFCSIVSPYKLAILIMNTALHKKMHLLIPDLLFGILS